MLKSAVILLLLSAMTFSVSAQTTAFTYQGKLTENSAPANNSYLMSFQLWTAQFAGQGTQIGATVTDVPVTVTNGIFTVNLDFGASAFSGAPRYLQISVRHDASESYLALSPRQPLASAPYSVRSLSAATADLATNSNQLGGAAASQFVQTNDARLTDARSPTAGSGFYIQNSGAATQTANFNISGDGTAGGILSGNVVNSATQFNLGNNRILTGSKFVSGGQPVFNLFAGFNAGDSNSSGVNNTFVGGSAGNKNTTGSGNTFVGKEAGFNNTTSNGNSFFGGLSGFFNSTGFGNSFFGSSAGFKSTANANSFFGESSGLNTTTGGGNSFFGEKSGFGNTTGAFNSFFGIGAGFSNTTADRNSFFGVDAGRLNQIGAGNSFFGDSVGYNNTADNNSFFGASAGKANTSGAFNTFVGSFAGQNNTVGNRNTLLGAAADVPSDSNLTGATAVGANAMVTQSNSIVLGAINGVNGATADTKVGIGTTAPKTKLEIVNGDIYLYSTNPAAVSGIILRSPNGACWKVYVDDSANLIRQNIACP